MNLASKIGEIDTPVLFANFNQDYSSLAVGLRTGYKLYNLANADSKLDLIYECKGEDIFIVERLFSSSLVAIVSLSLPRKLKVCHFKKGTEICSYSYSNTILAVRLNRQRLVVVLEESIYIHKINDMTLEHTIREIPPNIRGLCALSASNDNGYLAYPASSCSGEVHLFDTINSRPVTTIPAHNNPLAAIAFDHPTATKLATASEKGTVIRVWWIPDGQKLFEFRRGLARCVSINSLSFFLEGTFLAASSNTETVHIFKLVAERDRPVEEPQTWTGALWQKMGEYLPPKVSEELSRERDFAIARLPSGGLNNVCALTLIQKLPRLLICSQDGYLYVYNFKTDQAGECALVKQYRLDGSGVEQDESSAADSGQSKYSSEASAPIHTATPSSGMMQQPQSDSVPYREPPDNLVSASPVATSNDPFHSLSPAN